MPFYRRTRNDDRNQHNRFTVSVFFLLSSQYFIIIITIIFMLSYSYCRPKMCKCFPKISSDSEYLNAYFIVKFFDEKSDFSAGIEYWNVWNHFQHYSNSKANMSTPICVQYTSRFYKVIKFRCSFLHCFELKRNFEFNKI